MKNKGLKTKLEFKFNIDKEIPNLDYNIPLKPKKKSNRIKKINIKKNERDASTNPVLF